MRRRQQNRWESNKTRPQERLDHHTSTAHVLEKLLSGPIYEEHCHKSQISSSLEPRPGPSAYAPMPSGGLLTSAVSVFALPAAPQAPRSFVRSAAFNNKHMHVHTLHGHCSGAFTASASPVRTVHVPTSRIHTMSWHHCYIHSTARS